MANIKVKNNAGTEVVYNNVNAIVMPTTDGSTATFRQWNGAADSATPTIICKKQCIRVYPDVTYDEPTITITKGE